MEVLACLRRDLAVPIDRTQIEGAEDSLCRYYARAQHRRIDPRAKGADTERSAGEMSPREVQCSETGNDSKIEKDQLKNYSRL